MSEAQFIISAKEKTKPAFDKINRHLKSIEKQSARTQQSIAQIMTPLKAYLSFAGIRRLTSDFGTFEEALVKVGKTANIEGDELLQFGEVIKNLDIPLATKDLLTYGEAAGQLGIKGRAHLTKFIETMARLEKSSDLVGEAAAKSIARVLNVSGESIDTVDRFGSVIVALGNNFAASESEILNHTSEVSRAIAVYEIGSAKSAAFGTTMAALGIRAESGGSVVGRAFNAMNVAINSGGKKLQQLMAITGLTEQQLQRTFKDKADVVFQSFLTGLNKIDQGGGNMIATLEEFGLKGEEVNKTLPVMAKNSLLLAKAMTLASKEVSKAEALTKESNIAFSTQNAKLELTKKSLMNVSIELGNRLSPSLKNASALVRDFIGDTEDISSGLDTLSEVAFAGVIGMTARYTVTLGLASKAKIADMTSTYQKIKADQVAATQRLANTKAEHVYALSVFRSAQALKVGALGSIHYTVAANNELAARVRLTASINALQVAQTRHNVVTATGTVLTRTLSRSMAFLGGPAGVVMLAAGALAYFAMRTSDADVEGKAFSRTLDEILGKQKKMAMNALQTDINERMTQITLLKKRIVQVNEKLAGGFNQKAGLIEQGVIDDSIAKMQLLGAEITKIKEKMASVKSNDEEALSLKKLLEQGASTQDDGSEALTVLKKTQLAQQYQDLQTALMSEDALLLQTATKRQTLLSELWQAGVITDAEKYGALATQINTDYLTKLDAIEAQEIERNQAKLLRMDEQWLTESEKLDAQHNEELNKYKALVDGKLFTEQDYLNRKSKLEEKHKKAHEKLAKVEAKTVLNARVGLLNSMLTITGGQNKKLFQMQKMAALAHVAVTVPEAVVEAFKNGGGLPWGLPPAAATLAAGLKQISNIKKQSLGGGNSVSSSVGGSGAMPSLSMPSTNLESTLNTSINAGNRQNTEAVRNYFIVEGDLVGNDVDVMFAQFKEKIENTDAVLIESGTRQAVELTTTD